MNRDISLESLFLNRVDSVCGNAQVSAASHRIVHFNIYLFGKQRIFM